MKKNRRRKCACKRDKMSENKNKRKGKCETRTIWKM